MFRELRARPLDFNRGSSYLQYRLQIRCPPDLVSIIKGKGYHSGGARTPDTAMPRQVPYSTDGQAGPEPLTLRCRAESRTLLTDRRGPNLWHSDAEASPVLYWLTGGARTPDPAMPCRDLCYTDWQAGHEPLTLWSWAEPVLYRLTDGARTQGWHCDAEPRPVLYRLNLPSHLPFI